MRGGAKVRRCEGAKARRREGAQARRRAGAEGAEDAQDAEDTGPGRSRPTRAMGSRGCGDGAVRVIVHGIGSSASRFTSRSDSADSIDVTPGSTRSVSRRNVP